MKVIDIRGQLGRIDDELRPAHSEVTIELPGSLLYAQGHDNGVNRYYVLSKVSYFSPDRDEEDEDILEEYTTSSGSASSGDSDQDFIDFLGSWHDAQENQNDLPYRESEYALFFEIADQMLDNLGQDY